jgi:NAD(P)-dependent dehydrogenase (short-subunit alcohol dehydrogenase family)
MTDHTTEKENSRIALVTGGNRGIGKEICRQLARKGLHVILGSRSQSNGEAAAAELEAEGLPVEVLALDVSDAESIAQAVAQLKAKHGQIDVLVNNAGVFLDNQADNKQGSSSVFEIETAVIDETFTTNVYGPLRLIQAIAPLMQASGYGRIVNLSSGMGQLENMGGGSVAYRLSKGALNVITCIVEAELNADDIKVNAMCPGWVKTDMGGENATRDVAQGADTAVWLATLSADGPSGKFFRDRQELAW